MNIKEMKDLHEEARTNPRRTLIYIIIIIAIASIAFYVGGCLSEKGRQAATKIMPILKIQPVSFNPYAPDNPLAPGQYKAEIVIMLALKNDTIANNIKIKYDIEDGTGRRVNSKDWDAIAKQKPLVLSMTYPEVEIVRWTPDIPNDIKGIAQNRAKPFILRLLVTWEDIRGNTYKLESYSELRYDEKTLKYYFDERENKYI